MDFQLQGLLEPVLDEHPLAHEELDCDVDHFNNYAGVESDPEAIAIIEGYVEQGWLLELDSLDAVTAYLGRKPILSKLACIVKERPDGSTKRRIIMDSKAPSVTDASRKMFRSVLPRLTDMISDLLSLLATSNGRDVLMQLI